MQSRPLALLLVLLVPTVDAQSPRLDRDGTRLLETTPGIPAFEADEVRFAAEEGSVLGPFDYLGLAPQGVVDVAFGDGEYLAVWTNEDVTGAGSQWSVTGIWLDAEGVAQSSVFPIHEPAPDLEIFGVSVGTFQLPETRFAIAWSQDADLTGNRDVLFRVLGVGETAAGTPATLAGELADEIQPEVSSSQNPWSTVVWNEEGGGIRAGQVTDDGNGALMVVDLFDVSTNANDRRPSIIEDQGGSTLVAWHRDPAVGNNTLVARNWAGATPLVTEVEFNFRNTALGLDKPVCAAANPGDFLIAWQEMQSLTGSANDIYVRRVFFPGGAETTPTTSSAKAVEAKVNANEFDPALVFTGNAYLVSYQDASAGTTVIDSRVLDTMTAAELDIIPFQSAPSFGGHAVVPVDTSASNIDMALAVWTDGAVFGNLVETKGGPVIPLAGNCFVGGGETRVSTVTDGNLNFRVELWYAEAGASATLAIGDSSLFLPIGSAVLIPDPIGVVSYTPGNTSADGYISQSVPIPAGLAGNTAWLQWLVLSPSATCTSFPVHLSDGLEVTID